MTVPVGVGIGEMESAPARQAKLERGERLVAVVAQAIDGIDVNDGLRICDEVDLNFLLLDGVAGTERRRAGSRAKGRSEGGEKQRKSASA